MTWKRCPICAKKIDVETGYCTREGCPFRQKGVKLDVRQGELDPEINGENKGER